MVQTIKRPNFSILISPDSKLLLEEIENQLTKVKPPYGIWEKRFVWGDEPCDDNFWKNLNQKNLLGQYSAFIIRNAQLWNHTIWNALAKVVNTPLDDWLFICLEVEAEKNKFKVPPHIQKNGAYLLAQKNGWIWSRQKLAGVALQSYVLEKAKDKGLKFEKTAQEAFCSQLLPDAAFINNELEKLSLMTDDGIIKLSMLETFMASPETNNFAIIKNIQQGNKKEVLKNINNENASTLLFSLVALLARDLRICWQIINGEQSKISPYELKTKQDVARKLSQSAIAKGFSNLADAEWQVKSGRLSPEQALELLIHKMLIVYKK